MKFIILKLIVQVLKKTIDDYKKMAFKAGIVEGVLYDAAGIEKIANIRSEEHTSELQSQ